MLRSYYDCREWLEGFVPYTYSKENLGLARIKYLLKLLGDPQKEFKSILIGGTSGKGSTAFYLARTLEFAGPIATRNFKIGLHTSPHLVDIRERLQINGRMIPIDKFVKLISFIKPKVESMAKTKVGLPSYFEILVTCSFLYFAKEKVDWAVVEVGLGGRLDATNVLNQELSVITNVGLDHTEILGKTLQEIAREKAGIIKQGIPVVTASIGKALEVIKNVAKEKKASLITESTLKTNDKGYYDILRNIKDQIDIESGKEVYVTDECFFLVNLALNSLGIRLPEDKQKEIFSAGFEARFEEIDNGILIDGAHNRDKARVLVNWVQNSQQVASNKRLVKKITLVCAFKKGKDWKGILKLLLRELDIEKVITTQFNALTDTGRFAAVEPEEIKRFMIHDLGFKNNEVKSFKNSQEAVFRALRLRSGSSTVLITGSLYLAGEARTIWKLPEF